MNLSFRLLCAASLVLAYSVPCFAGTVLFSQSRLAVLSGVQSEAGPAAASSFVFDNFTLAQPADVKTISWEGYRFNNETIHSFFIGIFDNSALNSPGNPIYSAHIPGFANEAPAGPNIPSNFPPFYVVDGGYSGAVDVHLSGRTQYWITIAANVDDSATWLWANAQPYDSYSFVGDANGLRRTNGDFVFSLSGTQDGIVPPPPPAVTPEPSSLIFTASGMLSLAGVVRRKLARA